MDHGFESSSSQSVKLPRAFPPWLNHVKSQCVMVKSHENPMKTPLKPHENTMKPPWKPHENHWIPYKIPLNLMVQSLKIPKFPKIHRRWGASHSDLWDFLASDVKERSITLRLVPQFLPFGCFLSHVVTHFFHPFIDDSFNRPFV